MTNEDVLTRHETVRALVEQQYPNCRVTDIREYAKTTYKRRFQEPNEFVLAGMQVTYDVQTVSLDFTLPSVDCHVELLADGNLSVRDTTYIFYR